MQGIHEFGHVVAAMLTGGEVERIVWRVDTFSRTDVSPNPHPLIVCWAGPLLGAALPLIACAAFSRRRRVSPLWQFFAGFCLIANGSYLAAGSLDRAGDAGTLLEQGVPAWLLWICGGTASVAGLWLWHRMGGFAQLKTANVPTSRWVAQAILLFVTVAMQFLFFAAA